MYIAVGSRRVGSVEGAQARSSSTFAQLRVPWAEYGGVWHPGVRWMGRSGGVVCRRCGSFTD
jgi:hypothetical protein